MVRNWPEVGEKKKKKEIGQREMSCANAEKKQGSLLGDAGRLPGGGVRTGSRTMSRKFLKQSME